MKIAQVTHNYLPHIGGVEFYVKRMVESLKEKNEMVNVLTTDMATSKESRKPEAIYFKTSFAFLRNPFSIDFINHLRKNQYSIIHIHSVWFLHGLLAVLFSRKARIFTTIHGVYPDNSSFQLRFFLSIYKYFVSYVLQKAEKVLVYSEIEKNKLKKIFNVSSDKIVVLPMAIHIEPDVDMAKEKVILFTGRIIPDKNPDLLIKAISLLNNSFETYRVVFVGPIDANYRDELIDLSKKTGVSERIDFVGQLDPSVEAEKLLLQNHYKSASVFVSLGSWEGQPTRLMEAMQYRTPVIAFGAGGTADFVVDGKNGFVIEKLDAPLLANRLERILSDENLSARLGQEARLTIVNEYAWNTVFQKIFQLYHP